MKTIQQLKWELKQKIIERMENAKSREDVLQIWNEDKRMGIPKECKRMFCNGCRQNYYNGQGAKECWNLGSAKLKKRKIYKSLDSTKPEDVVTLNCYTQQYK